MFSRLQRLSSSLRAGRADMGSAPSGEQYVKLLVVGDGWVGKSSLLITYNTGTFPSDYVPTVFDNYTETRQLDGVTYHISFWDTAGQEDYDRLRPLSYPQTDICFLCFAMDNMDSLTNAANKYVPELRHYIPEVPILLVGCKQDVASAGISTSAEQVVKDHKLVGFVETSAKKNYRVQACFDEGLYIYLQWKPHKKRLQKMNKHADIQMPPIMPPAGKAPTLEITTSTFSQDWLTMMSDDTHTDLLLVFTTGDVGVDCYDSTNSIRAHSMILAAASSFWFDVLKNIRPGLEKGGYTEAARDHYISQVNSTSLHDPISHISLQDQQCSGDVTDVDMTSDVSMCKSCYVITFHPEVDITYFRLLLECWYTGTTVTKLHEEMKQSIDVVCKQFRFTDLSVLCTNVIQDREYLNPSIGTYANDETGRKLGQLYINNPENCDVRFTVSDGEVYAHQVVLACRSEVFAAMFSRRFMNHGQHANTGGNGIIEIPLLEHNKSIVQAVVQYLYTDHAPIEDVDMVELLVVADLYCQKRLITLVELYVTKLIERLCNKSIQHADVDVVGILHTAQIYNADQLQRFCLHFISTNYTAFILRSEFNDLEGDDLEYVEKHRWPPADYLHKVKVYEEYLKKHEKDNGKCVIM